MPCGIRKLTSPTYEVVGPREELDRAMQISTWAIPKWPNYFSDTKKQNNKRTEECKPYDAYPFESNIPIVHCNLQDVDVHSLAQKLNAICIIQA